LDSVTIKGTLVSVVKGDLTEEDTDIIGKDHNNYSNLQ